MPTHWPLAIDKARYAGDGVAVVVADEPRARPQDAAELVEVDYEPLPAVDRRRGGARGRRAARARRVRHEPLLHVEARGRRGRRGCSPRPRCTVKERYRQQRLIPNAIEPRGVVVQPVPATGEFTLWSATQIPHICARTLAMVIGIPEAKLRVDRARRRRRLRLEAERLRRGGARARARAAARPPGQVDREAHRGLPGDDPRPRRRPGDRARGDRGRDDHRRARAADRRRWARTSSS